MFEGLTRHCCAQWRNVYDAFRLILEAERARGAQYEFLIRARFDYVYLHALPPLSMLRAGLSRHPETKIFAPTKGHCTCPTNTFGGEIPDKFGFVRRQSAEAYFTVSTSRHWCESI